MRAKFKWVFTLLVTLALQFSFGQERTVTGIVADELGPVVGANVVNQSTSIGTTTDFDGNFSIKAKNGDVLLISFAGNSQTVKIDSRSNYSITLKAVALTATTVQGYRTVTKKSAVTSVAVVDSKTIENRPNANAINTIQGQLAGVNITASTGQPGAKSTVIIRGVGSINGTTDPLYVIDGFPTTSDNFRTINSNDIESFTVLKDAAAIAEYGNRGSNGVIIVKTKQAKFGEAKMAFRYSSQTGVGFLQNTKYKFANAKELLRIEKNVGQGLGANLTDTQIDNWTTDTDWVKYFFRPTRTSSHNLSIENSNTNFASFTSLGYFDQDGILESTGLKRFTLRNNINGKSTNEKFKYQVNTAFGYSKNNEATSLGTGAINRNYVNGAFLGASYVSPSVYTGPASAFDYYDSTPGLLATPIMLIDKLNNYANLTEEARFDVATDFSYKLFKDFTISTRLNAQLLDNRNVESEFPNSFNALLFSPTAGVSSLNGGAFNGTETIRNRREFYFNSLWQANYNKTIGKSTLNLNANMEYNHARLNVNNMTQRGLIEGIFVPNTGAGYVTDIGTNDFYVPIINASNLRNDLISYFGSADYDFDKKYGAVVSVRYDGTSRFVNDKRWGTFYSVGGRWNIDEEAFMDNINDVTVLKLRASYGTVGNQRINSGTVFAGTNPPGFANNYSITNNTYNGGHGYNLNFGYAPLQWETTTQWNAGVDFELFNSRWRGSFDYYNKETSDLFLDNPVTPSSGTPILTKNTDVLIVNSGIELNIAYDLIKTTDIKWTLRANGAMNNNKVKNYQLNNGRLFTSDGLYVSQNGGRINEPYVFHYLGVNPANGNLLFEDANGNPTENPVQADRKAAGVNNIPVYQGGFGFDFDYKGFFASTLFTYAFDVKRFDNDYAGLLDKGSIGQFTVSNELLNAWTSTNTNTNIPAINSSNAGLSDQSDRFLVDASYIRVRNIQIGYNVPNKFFERTFVRSLSFVLQGENLYNFTKWKGFDPESDRLADYASYPTPKIFTFGLDLKF